MESQPHNPEFRNNPENVLPCISCMVNGWILISQHLLDPHCLIGNIRNKKDDNHRVLVSQSLHCSSEISEIFLYTRVSQK